MTAKRYRIFMNRRKYDYTYDQQTGVARVRLPGGNEFTCTKAATPTIARNDVRRLLEKATGQKAMRSPQRTLFLHDVLRLLAESGWEDISENDLAAALAKVNNAITEDRRRALGISHRWRSRMAYANRKNDASAISADDAADLAEIVMHGGKVTYG